jgi:signal transduction histidine kinase
VLNYIGSEPLAARVDRNDARRAIANLVANALQHIPAGGQVTLDLRRRRDWAEIVVSDDGFGLDAGVREHLFERNAGRSRPGAGTGLGLYIASRIAQRAGGTVRYEENVPRGSRFVFAVPVHQ